MNHKQYGLNFLKYILRKISWSALSSVIFVALQAILFIIVAKNLSPSSIGLYSLAITIIIIPLSIIENSISQSLIYHTQTNVDDVNAVFTLNAIAALVGSFFLGMVFLFFKLLAIHSAILGIASVLLICLLLAAYNAVKIALLKKELRYFPLAMIEIISSIIYFIVVLTLIKKGFDFWALVIGMIVKYVVVSVLLFALFFRESWMRIEWKNTYIKRHWQYGKFILFEKALSATMSYIDILIIASVMGYSTLGIYDVLKRIILRPLVILYNSVEQVFFPLLSKFQNQAKEYISSYKAISLLSKHFFVNFLIIVYLFAPVLIGVLPDVYSRYILELKALIMFGMVVIVVNPIDIILYSQGKTRLFFKWISAYFLPLLLVSYFSASFGLQTMLITLSVFYLILFILAFWILKIRQILPFKLYFGSFFYVIFCMSFLLIIDYQMELSLQFKLIVLGLIVGISGFKFKSYVKNEKSIIVDSL